MFDTNDNQIFNTILGQQTEPSFDNKFGSTKQTPGDLSSGIS